MTILAIGIDSFDTAYAGCTTHFTSLLLIELLNKEIRILDYPWLIRLNPAAPWKSRGNGATAILLQVDSRHEEEEVISTIKPLLKVYTSFEHHRKASIVTIRIEGESLTDFFVNRDPCLKHIHTKAVHEIVDISVAHNCLKKLNTLYVYGKENRGVIGALSALGADFTNDFTFELLTYRSPENWLKKRTINEDTVIEFDLKYRPLTFSNYDYENSKPLISPHTYDPVLYGVRGEEPDILLKALEIIDTGEEKPTHWTIFRTNQATNMHLRQKQISRVHPYDNPILQGVIVEKPHVTPGGHVIARLGDKTSTIDIVAYRETGRLRKTLLQLDTGDEIIVAGQAKIHKGRLTLNLEYIRVHATHHYFINPTRYCDKNTIYPPLSTIHHLSKPPERCLYNKKKIIRELTQHEINKVVDTLD
jgi:tRNA(Ile2)-agmatinylcytidine synthase